MLPPRDAFGTSSTHLFLFLVSFSVLDQIYPSSLAMDALSALPNGDFINGVATALVRYGSVTTFRAWAASNTEFRSCILGQRRGRWDAFRSEAWLNLILGSADRIPRCDLDFLTAHLLDINMKMTRDFAERQQCVALLLQMACRHFTRMYNSYRLFSR